MIFPILILVSIAVYLITCCIHYLYSSLWGKIDFEFRKLEKKTSPSEADSKQPPTKANI